MIPTCHRTIRCAPSPTANETHGSPCIGSRCALWLPQYAEVKGDGVTPGQRWNRMERTGEGACADNPGRLRVDPAAEVKDA